MAVFSVILKKDENIRKTDLNEQHLEYASESKQMNSKIALEVPSDFVIQDHLDRQQIMNFLPNDNVSTPTFSKALRNFNHTMNTVLRNTELVDKRY